MGLMVILLVVALPVLGGIAGVVLFIVGLVRKKAAMWGSGLALAIVSVMIFVVGLIGAAFFWYRAVPTLAAPPPRALRRPTVMPMPMPQPGRLRRTSTVASPRAAFLECTGVSAPADVTFGTCRVVSRGSPDQRSIYCLTLNARPAFVKFLQGYFQKVTWQEARRTLQDKDALAANVWTRSAVVGKAYYFRAHRMVIGPPTTLRTMVAYDAAGGTAYVAGLRLADGPAAPRP